MQNVNPLRAVHALKRLKNSLGANRSDVRLWFTGLSEAFEGAHLDDYPKGYKQKIQAPWPQPSPHFPGEMAPTVLHVPQAEIDEFLDKVVNRYISTLQSGWLQAFAASWLKPELEPVSDLEFIRILLETPFARMLCEKLDERDHDAFKSVLSIRSPGKPGQLFKLDLSPLSQIRTHAGQELKSTVTLLERFPNGKFQVLGIRLEHRLIHPSEGSHWELAKYFVLQGCANALIASIHPRVHFPVDAMNAITKTLLPETHPLARILIPHCYLQLPLNFAVLYIDRSVAHNHQREIYTPFPMTRDGFMQLIRLGYSGTPGNSAWTTFRFEMGGQKFPGPYAQYLDRYYEVCLRFVNEWLHDFEIDDLTLKWADSIAGYIPGFPTGVEMKANPGLLREAAATFIHNVSIVHSADHIVYARESIRKVPLRLRAKVPRADDEKGALAPLNRKTLVRRGDLFRHQMARTMYFQPNTVFPLTQVRYECLNRQETLASAEFFRRMRLLDREESMRRFVPLQDLACSIQY